MSNPLKIYIASKYTADTEQEMLENTLKVIDAGIQIYKKGHYPYIPHLTHWVDRRTLEINNPLQWQDYMNWHMKWLECCDALLYLSSSKGADIELNRALELGKIIYCSIDEIKAGI